MRLNACLDSPQVARIESNRCRVASRPSHGLRRRGRRCTATFPYKEQPFTYRLRSYRSLCTSRHRFTSNNRRDQQARGQRRRQVANVQVPWSEIRGTCFRTHPQQLAVAAAAAASHPELDDNKIIPEATVDLQVRPEPPRAASPPPTSP